MLNRLRDVFASLQTHRVNYVVIGGIAAVLHGSGPGLTPHGILHTAQEPSKNNPGGSPSNSSSNPDSNSNRSVHSLTAPLEAGTS
jgi:hypothetical protein